jgi:hypothetical protein
MPEFRHSIQAALSAFPSALRLRDGAENGECVEMTTQQVYRTGEVAPESGVYRLVSCECVSPAQLEIPLAKGERFPPCRTCHGAVTWQFVRPA